MIYSNWLFMLSFLPALPLIVVSIISGTVGFRSGEEHKTKKLTMIQNAENYLDDVLNTVAWEHASTLSNAIELDEIEIGKASEALAAAKKAHKCRKWFEIYDHLRPVYELAYKLDKKLNPDAAFERYIRISKYI